MRIPLAKEGRLPVFSTFAAGTALALSGNRFVRKVGATSLLFSGGLAWFFRDPDRAVVPIEHGVLAPADGKVIRIARTTLREFREEPVRCVSIFMNIHNCHVNRAPISGRVTKKTVSDGGFLAAWDERASEENRRAALQIEGEFPVYVRQVAGLVARQIVTRPEVGDEVVQGGRYGIIKFGSRVDVFFPLELRLMVEIGETTIAGITALARLPD